LQVIVHRTGNARSRRAAQSGQALIELALVAPILVMFLAGLVQFALIFERQIGINNAVREAARRTAALAAPDQSTAQANAGWARNELLTLLGNSQAHTTSRDTIVVCIVNPTTNPSDPAGNLNVVVRISESYRHPLFMPIVDLILDGIDGVTDQSLAVSASTEFHVEQTGNANNVGSGGAAGWDGLANTTPTCTP
jgi:Flp pilus assembly protein TadG